MTTEELSLAIEHAEEAQDPVAILRAFGVAISTLHFIALKRSGDPVELAASAVDVIAAVLKGQSK